MPLAVPLNRLSHVGEVTGRLEDEAGAGLSGVIVQVAGLAVVTDQNGSFTFPTVPEGAQLLVVSAAGALADTVTVPALPHRVHVNAGKTAQANFRVIKAAAVAGQVRFVQPESDAAPPTGPESDVILGSRYPEQGAELAANLAAAAELRSAGFTLRARTDAEGRFAFRGLTPGVWHLTVLQSEGSERYRLTPETQELVLSLGRTARAEVALTPVARTIQFMEGGTLSAP